MPQYRRSPLLPAVLLAGLGLLPVRAAADVYGIVVGIDDYTHIGSLQGAANDARDIADALRVSGAREMTVLIDRDATREAVIQTWRDYAARGRPGDTLFVSFAGHGAQFEEVVPGAETDGMDEAFLFGEFPTEGVVDSHYLRDDDIASLIEEAGHMTVVMVADACHSGTLTRSIDPRVGARSVRFADVGAASISPPPDLAPPLAELEEADNLVFLGAVRDNELAEETRIDGQVRGALSYSVAAALRGAADVDGDGGLSKEELEQYVRASVRQIMQGRQHPQIFPAGRPRSALIPPSLLALYVMNSADVDIETLLVPFDNIQSVGGPNRADLVWDLGFGELLSGVEVVARMPDELHLSAVVDDRLPEAGVPLMQAYIDRWRLVNTLRENFDPDGVIINFQPGDQTHFEGSRVEVQVEGMEYPFLTLLNIASDGTINFLYPLAEYNDSPAVPLGRTQSFTLEVEAPFGADHFVAIASDRELRDLHAELGRLDGTRAVNHLRPLLTRDRLGLHQMGMHGLYTAPGG